MCKRSPNSLSFYSGFLPGANVGNLAAEVITFDKIEAKDVEWLWKGFLPRGKLSLLDGDPGLGKSTVLLDIAARVSAHGVMPDQTQVETGNVMLMSAEDDPDDTIKPRLTLAGANMQRVF